MGEGGEGGFAVAHADKLKSVREVGFEPEQCSASNVTNGFEVGEMNGMVDGVECCAQVE